MGHRADSRYLGFREANKIAKGVSAWKEGGVKTLDTTNKVVIVIAIAFVLVIAITVGWLIWQIEQARLAATIPSSPEALRSVKVTTTEVTLEWNDVSNNELGFKLFRNGELVRDDIPKDSTSMFDYGLQPSTVYEYEVVASNKAGDSLRSEAV